MSIGWSNYHAHTKFCDGRMTVDEAADMAIHNGIKIFGFSSHAPVPFFSTWNMQNNQLQDYLIQVDNIKQRYSEKISILKALEIDYIPGVVNPHSFNLFGLDYTIGSVHFIDEFADGMPWTFDGTTDDFLMGLKEIFRNDIKACVKRYYYLVREMMLLYPPTIVGHFDKIKMHNSATSLFDERDDWYREELDKTLDVIKDSGVILEINTKSFDRNMKLYPGVDLFSEIKTKNIPVTINSDCHRLEFMTVGYTYVAKELLKSGISEVSQMVGGEWKSLPLTEHGVFFS